MLQLNKKLQGSYEVGCIHLSTAVYITPAPCDDVMYYCDDVIYCDDIMQ